MSPITLTVDLVPQVGHSGRRAVAFLRGHLDLTAGIEYDALVATPVGKRLRHRMGLWIAFVPDARGKYHRYKAYAPKYRRCFVFIDIEEKMRLYGFACHPKPNDSAFELIVLTTHAIKKENETDLSELDRVVMWQDHMATKIALQVAYSDSASRTGN
jgi:hypothetical protein